MNAPRMITLLTETYSQDAYGVMTKTTSGRSVIADVQSVTGSEWFEGGRNGLNPEYRMRVHHGEYKGEQMLVYNGIIYTIYRTYMDNDIIELYVERKKGSVEHEANAAQSEQQ